VRRRRIHPFIELTELIIGDRERDLLPLEEVHGMRFSITGKPGSGKTTVAMRVRDILSNHGFSAGGIICPEIRLSGRRVGFEIVDLLTGEKGILAHTSISGPKVGKYGVNLRDLSKIGHNAILRAIREADYVLIDEIAPMELKSEKFIRAVEEVLDRGKPLLAVVHMRSKHPLVERVKTLSKTYIVDEKNRGKLPDEIAREMLGVLKSGGNPNERQER